VYLGLSTSLLSTNLLFRPVEPVIDDITYPLNGLTVSKAAPSLDQNTKGSAGLLYLGGISSVFHISTIGLFIPVFL